MKGGKFRPTGRNNQTVHGTVILDNERGQKVGVAKMNFVVDSNKLLEAKKLHITTEVEGEKVAEEIIKLPN